MPRDTYINPAGGGISGGKVGVTGDRIYFLPQIMRPNFQQRIINFTDEADEDGPMVFHCTREVFGTLQLAGRYETKDDHIANFLGAFSKTDPLAVTVTLDNGHEYEGTVLLEKASNDWNNKEGEVIVNMLLYFTGWINGEGGGSGEYDSGDSGGEEAKIDIKQGMLRNVGYQDTREDTARRPFIAIGVDEGSASPLDAVIASVVSLAGGTEHTWKGDDTLKLRDVQAEWAGYGVVKGVFIYSRYATDCKQNNIKYSVGYVTRGYEAAVDSGNDSGGSDDVCQDLMEEGIGGFSIQYIHRVKRAIPYTVMYVPCVWDANPTDLGNEMKGKINSNAITIDGISIPAYELRFDGFEVERFVTPAGDRWSGYMKFARMVGGFIDTYLTCSKAIAVDGPPGQTFPSYTVGSSVRTLYEYSSATFQSLAQLCSLCYG